MNSDDRDSIDLNMGPAVNFEIDLNMTPNSPEILSRGFFFDLNQKPCDEDVHTGFSDNVGENFEVVEPEGNINAQEIVEQEYVEVLDSQDQRRSLRTLTNEERKAIHHILLQNGNVNGALKRGVKHMLAESFSVSEKTIQRIWQRAKEDGEVSHRKTISCGRKRVQIDPIRLRQVPLPRRTTLRSLSHALDINVTSLFRQLKSGIIRRHSNAIKPVLKEKNKKSRLQFCLSMLEESSMPHDPIFKSMDNVIHIDEKWFYLTKKSENYYLLPDEEDPLRTCINKNFIIKVMFLVALARPRFDSEGNEVFSGKIGVFPFVTQEPAKRTSVNRIAGTLETKAMTSVNRETMRSFFIEKVLPAIKEKWPIQDLGRPIFIQQDNARTHIHKDDHEFHQALMQLQGEFDIRLMCQPANSPDLNVLDLGFFAAIQSLQHKESPKTIDELVSAVIKSFDDYPTKKSDRIFLTLQSCMIEIMKLKGSNKYKIPHIGKESLQRVGQLPTQLKCDPMLVQEVLDYLNVSN